MLSLFLIPLLVTGGFEAGGRVGAVFPASGLETNHSSSASFGAYVGYAFGRSRVDIGYGYFSLPSRQASAYRFENHELTLQYGYELLRAAGWGIEASAGAGFGLFRRVLTPALETGTAPAAHLGVGFYQGQGHSRVTLGFDSAVYVESVHGSGTSSVALTWLPAIKAGVGYVF
jgi:hypothetical protein